AARLVGGHGDGLALLLGMLLGSRHALLSGAPEISGGERSRRAVHGDAAGSIGMNVEGDAHGERSLLGLDGSTADRPAQSNKDGPPAVADDPSCGAEMRFR